jgi:uncharacterized protein YqcC (DUF446 family)
MPDPGTVLAAAGRIEAELRRLGWWSATPPPDEAFDFAQPFAMDTLAFSQWLQWIFLPRVKEAAAEGAFPASSHVAAQAVREFDGRPEASTLLELLADFDALFG